MQQTMKATLESLGDGRAPLNLSVLNDPLAMKIEWSPAKRGGANFRTHKLVVVDSSRMEFRASMGAKLFALIFLVAGMGIMIGPSYAKLSSGSFTFSAETVVPILLGLVFAAAGAAIFYVCTNPIVFDKSKGVFWKGRKPPDEGFHTPSSKHVATLDQIHALQLVSELCHGNNHSNHQGNKRSSSRRGNNSPYYSYELNLVLADGRRINVVDHGDRRMIKENADTLAAFLNKPVWDAM